MYAVVDIETTGGNAQYHRITEVAVLVHDGNKIIDTFHTLINPEQFVPNFITQLTGITNEMVESSPTFKEIAEELYSILFDKIFVAHNAAFDYAFLKSLFEIHGYQFKVKRLCTVRLSRKIFPGYKSYSLGKFSNELGIEINGRHRAYGDAAATAEIFSRLVKNDPGDVIENYLKRNSKEQYLPPHVDKKIIESLPAKPGVYYFHDASGNVIYVGKAKNIKSRVLGHFTYADNDGKENSLRNVMHDVSYTLTGNELIALLLESEEIKRKSPQFNYAQKLWDRNYCIFKFIDQNGYIHLAIERYNRKKEMLRIFPDYLSTRQYLTEKMLYFNLCAKLCHLQEVKKACHNVAEKICYGACIGEESADDYNMRTEEAIKSFNDDLATYFIIGKGRTYEEHSVIYVEKGHYLGFGFIDATYFNNDHQQLKECIKWRPDTPDVQRILNMYLTKYPNEKRIYTHIENSLT
ncbi:MAG: 3'-5' exoribonuclease [Fimbriimonadaceae bacterium]|nr:3'-5' exoribonuclease [Chitinophagales bacterium]